MEIISMLKYQSLVDISNKQLMAIYVLNIRGF